MRQSGIQEMITDSYFSDQRVYDESHSRLWQFIQAQRQTNNLIEEDQ